LTLPFSLWSAYSQLYPFGVIFSCETLLGIRHPKSVPRIFCRLFP
jgi:hypothetical protein